MRDIKLHFAHSKSARLLGLSLRAINSKICIVISRNTSFLLKIKDKNSALIVEFFPTYYSLTCFMISMAAVFIDNNSTMGGYIIDSTYGQTVY